MGRDGPRVRGCCWGLARVSPGVGALRGKRALWAGRGCCPACRTGGRGVSRPGHPGLLALQQAGAPGQQGNIGLSPTVLSPGTRRWPCCPGQTDQVEAASIQHATFPGQPGSRGCVEPGAAFCNEPSGGAEGGSRGSSASRAACPGPAAGRPGIHRLTPLSLNVPARPAGLLWTFSYTFRLLRPVKPHLSAWAPGQSPQPGRQCRSAVGSVLEQPTQSPRDLLSGAPGTGVGPALPWKPQRSQDFLSKIHGPQFQGPCKGDAH